MRVRLCEHTHRYWYCATLTHICDSQVCFELWLAASLLADAIAIAAQALLAPYITEADRGGARAVVRRTAKVGIAIGVATAGALTAVGAPLRGMFTTDAASRAAAASVWPIVVATQPLTTTAFAYDGLLFGASDFGFCAGAMVVSAASAILVMRTLRPALGLSGVWAGLGTLMLLRAALAALRISLRRGPWGEALGS